MSLDRFAQVAQLEPAFSPKTKLRCADKALGEKYVDRGFATPSDTVDARATVDRLLSLKIAKQSRCGAPRIPPNLGECSGGYQAASLRVNRPRELRPIFRIAAFSVT